VRELVGRVRNVVLMNVYLDLENPGGSGFWVGGYMSQVREMGKLVYEQPGNEVDGSCHSKEGSKSVEKGRKGSKRESARGKRSKGNVLCIYESCSRSCT
jgi:hypothetical protein